MTDLERLAIPVSRSDGEWEDMQQNMTCTMQGSKNRQSFRRWMNRISKKAYRGMPG